MGEEATRKNHFTVALQTHDSPSPVPFRCNLTFDFADEWGQASGEIPVCIVFNSLIETHCSSGDSSSCISNSHSCERPHGRQSPSSRFSAGNRSQCNQPCRGDLASR